MIQKILASVLILSHYTRFQCVSHCLKAFPQDFLFGVASSAYQVEGAWNEGGKSLSSWDSFTRTHSHIILDGSTGDVTTDAYHNTEEDVSNLKYLGVNYYRFSLSWTRILPATNKVNMEGVQYYNRLINLLLENKIQPMVTIFHWDLPYHLQELGGFTNPEMIDFFAQYASVVFEQFGDRVKIWSTFNEPRIFCAFGYGNVFFPPGINQSGIADYLCGHNILKAHAKVYHLYNDKFKPVQKGRITLNLDGPWGEPASNVPEDLAASERYMQFQLGWFAHPIFSKNGDYPTIMKELVAKHSKVQGFPRSRLPVFTQAEIDYIKGTYDFFFLNHYQIERVANIKLGAVDAPSYTSDSECDITFDNSWPNTSFSYFKAVPWAFTKLLVWIKEEYDNPEIYITESGCTDESEILDTSRISYFKDYLNALLEAICVHGVNVKGYTAWSFMDSFEWFSGYTLRFGLYHVNFTDPLRPRTPKSSVEYYKKVISTKQI